MAIYFNKMPDKNESGFLLRTNSFSKPKVLFANFIRLVVPRTYNGAYLPEILPFSMQ